MNLIRRNIANAVTCCNVLCGTLAIMLCASGQDSLGGIACWQWACLAIVVAAVADFCDGLVARATGVSGPLGKELDSLSDLVSFGVAPAMLLFTSLRALYAPEWWMWLAALLPVAGAVRLAKFNIYTRQTTSFLGLPIPANAIFWIGYVWMMRGAGESFLGQWWCVIPVVVLLSGLMVSELPLLALKFKNLSWRDNAWRWILIIGIVILLTLFGMASLMWIVMWYILISIVSKIS